MKRLSKIENIFTTLADVYSAGYKHGDKVSIACLYLASLCWIHPVHRSERKIRHLEGAYLEVSDHYIYSCDFIEHNRKCTLSHRMRDITERHRRLLNKFLNFV